MGPSPQQTGQQDATATANIWDNIIKQQEQYNQQQNEQLRGATGSLDAGNSGYADAGATRPALGGVQAPQATGAPATVNAPTPVPAAQTVSGAPQPAAANTKPQGVGAEMASIGNNPNAQGMGALTQGFAQNFQPKKKAPQPAPAQQPVPVAMNAPS